MFAVLGPLEVHADDGTSLTVPGGKERQLLAILTAGSPGVVSFDALAESLWNGDPPASARKSLQVHITRLRASLEPGRPRGSTGRFIVRRGPGYALPLPREAVDALRIGDLAARGRALLTSGQPEDAAREFTAAVDPAVPPRAVRVARGGLRGRRARPHAGRAGALPARPAVPAQLQLARSTSRATARRPATRRRAAAAAGRSSGRRRRPRGCPPG